MTDRDRVRAALAQHDSGPHAHPLLSRTNGEVIGWLRSLLADLDRAEAELEQAFQDGFEAGDDYRKAMEGGIYARKYAVDVPAAQAAWRERRAERKP